MSRGRLTPIQNLPLVEHAKFVPEAVFGMPESEFEYLLQIYGDKMVCVLDANLPNTVYCIINGTKVMFLLRPADAEPNHYER